MRFKLELPAGISKDEIQNIVMDHDKTKQYIGDKKIKLMKSPYLIQWHRFRGKR